MCFQCMCWTDHLVSQVGRVQEGSEEDDAYMMKKEEEEEEEEEEEDVSVLSNLNTHQLCLRYQQVCNPPIKHG